MVCVSHDVVHSGEGREPVVGGLHHVGGLVSPCPVVEVGPRAESLELDERVLSGLGVRVRGSLHIDRDVIVRAAEVSGPCLNLLVLVVRCDGVVYCGPVEWVVAADCLSADVIGGSERSPAEVLCVEVLDLCVICVSYAHDAVCTLIERRKRRKLGLHLGIAQAGRGHHLACTVKDVHVHAVDLLGEYLRVLVAQIAQGETVDVVAIAVVLLDAGSGDSAHHKKRHEEISEFHKPVRFD